MFKKPDFPGFRKKKSASASQTKKTASIKNEGLSLLDDIDEETDINGNEKPATVGELITSREVLKERRSSDHKARFSSKQKRLRLLSSAMMPLSKPRKDLYLNTACLVRSFRPSEFFCTHTCMLSPSPFLQRTTLKANAR